MSEAEMRLVVWDVEHGACAMIRHFINGIGGRLAMIDSGCKSNWRPSTYITQNLQLHRLDYLFITNADQDHMSDLQGLWDANVEIPVFIRNPSYSGEQMKQMKLLSWPLSKDAKRYVNACSTFSEPTQEPFNQYMGGISASVFWNNYPNFTDTNNLSLVIFIRFAGWTFLFPGDLEVTGWKALLHRPDFQDELRTTSILIASHHGRQSGFCPEIFDYCHPQAVVISDKPIMHETQRTAP